MNRKGFTLIELVMVIVIIGILAAVAIPKFMDLRTEAEIARCQADAGAIRTGISGWYAKFHANNGNWNDADSEDNGFPTSIESAAFANFTFQGASLPPTSHIVNETTKVWSSYYTNTDGIFDMDSACAE